MKKEYLYLLALLGISFILLASNQHCFSQNHYKYTLVLSENSKENLGKLAQEASYFNTYLNESFVTFESFSSQEQSYFDSIAHQHSFQIIEFERGLENNSGIVPVSFKCATCTINWSLGSQGDATMQIFINGNIEVNTTSGSSGSFTICDGDEMYVNTSSSGANLVVSSSMGNMVNESGLNYTGVVFYTTSACSSTEGQAPPSDCEGAINVCSNESFAGYPLGYGEQELNSSNRGCLSDDERQSQWYYVYVEEGGVLTFSIEPHDTSTDYDFAVWGPFDENNVAENCPPTSPPIRCNYSATTPNTGLSTSTSNTSQSAGGNPWVRHLDTSPGEVYIILIDNWTRNISPFNLNWGGDATLGCVTLVLPIELTYFVGKNQESSNLIEWETMTERNNEYFQLERSIDGINWHPINTQEGAQNSTEAIKYFYRDYSFQSEINYYRLTQVDFDGKSETFEPISIDNRIAKRDVIKYVNQIGQEVRSDYDGFKIVIYSDGTTEKVIGN